MEKRHLPATRTSITHKVTVMSDQGDSSVFIIVGMYDTGEVGELFVNLGKQGSTLRGALDCWARMVSVALQWGVPLEDVIDKFKSVSFEPSGKTDNPEIPSCMSVVDYTMRWLEKGNFNG